MADKEFLVYMVDSSLEAAPTGVRYRNYKDAVDAASRLAEKEQRKYYVHEVVMVCNTVAEI